MCQVAAALGVHSTVAGFLREFPNCYPPLVFNITDGESTDGIPEKDAANLRARLPARTATSSCSTPTSPPNSLRPIEYPDSEEGLPDQYARRLFRMSSGLPPKLLTAAKNEGLRCDTASSRRGFVFNADLIAIIRFIDIGTQVLPPRLSVEVCHHGPRLETPLAFAPAPPREGNTPEEYEDFAGGQSADRPFRGGRWRSPKARSPACGPNSWWMGSWPRAKGESTMGRLKPLAASPGRGRGPPGARLVRRGEASSLGGLYHVPGALAEKAPRRPRRTLEVRRRRRLLHVSWCADALLSAFPVSRSGDFGNRPAALPG